MTTTHTPLIRRLRDADGQLVTYLPSGQLCQAVGIASSTLTNWARQGLVRYTDSLNGSRNYAVVDAAKLKLMTTKEAHALGIQKSPDRALAAQRQWYADAQASTRPRAQYHGEEWDDYDIKFLVESLQEGRTMEVIAKALGRSYAAVACEVSRLHAEGDLPYLRPRENEGWQERTIELLTPAEIASLLDRERAA